MSDTRKVLVVTDNRTIIKKIKIGTPIRNVTQGGQTTAQIDDLETGVKAGGDVLIYQPSTDTYHSAQIASGTNINVTYDSDTLDLTVATALDSLTGSIIPDSNEVYDLGSSSKKFRDLYLSGSTINLGTLRLEDSGGSFIVKDSDGRPVLTEVSLITTNTNILSYDSATGIFNFNDSDVARTDIDETFHKNLTVASGLTADSATLGGINLSGNDLTTTGKLYFSNVFSNVGDLPDASTYHGMFAHVHGTGSAYFAHAGNWVKLLDSDGYILSAGTGLNYDSANRQFSLANTGVTAASYGSSTTVPQISINAQGQIDSARNITIAGVTGVDFDSATGTITIQTTGGDFSDVITLDPYSTSNLAEGDNLYYTTLRADSAFDVRLATKSTDNLSEGSNLYYTTGRADSDAKNAISVSDAGGDGSLTYNSANGVITYTGPSAAEIRAHFQAGTGVTYDSASGTLSIGQGVATTDNVTFNNLVVSGNLTVSGTETTVNTETINLADNEIVLNSNFDSGTPTENGGISIRRGNLANKTLLWNETTDKWTVGSEIFEAGTFEGNLTGDVTGQVSSLGNHSTTNLSEGDNLYYTTARADSAFDVRLATKSTTDVSEGTNLYYTTARADSDAKNAISVTDAGGDGSMSYNAGTGVITYTGPSASEVRAHFTADKGLTVTNGEFNIDSANVRGMFVGGTGITYTSGTGTFDITNTGVTAGTYGSASLVPVVTVNAQGQIDSIGTVSVAGVSSIDFDSATGNFTINTADGGTFVETITLDPYTTSNLIEGSNLYYTTARADSAFDVRLATKTTDNLSQGSTNKYYDSATTETTARYAISVTDAGGDGSISYNVGTGAITYTGPSATEVRAHLVAGTGITYDSANGVIASAYQGLDTTDSVTFSGLYVSGNTVLGGNLTVTGTTTTVNTETINLADNIILLNSNHTGSATQSAGIEVERGSDSNTSLLWDEAADRWSIGSNNFAAGTFIGNLTGQASDISNHTTDNLTQGSTNLYYDSATTETTARYSLSVTDAGGDGSLTYNKGTGVFTYTGPSASEVRSHINVSGDLAYDSSTGQISFTQRTDQQVRNIFSVSGDLAYDSGTGQVSFTQRTNQEVRNLFSASGDLSYDSSTGQFSFDVEEVYTKANFDSDFDTRLGQKTTDNLTEGSTNKYYDSATTQTNARYAISVTDAGGDGSLAYNVGTGVITYTGPGAAEVRSHFQDGTGVTYDSASGQISIGQDVSTTSDVTFGKVTQDSAVSKGIRFIPQTSAFSQTAGSLHFDSAYDKGLTVRLNTPENANPDVNLNIGQETFLYAKNETGAAISNGDAVYISGTETGDGHPLIMKARANTSPTSAVFGLATMDIPDGAHGWVTRYGLVRDVNTGGMTEGSVLFLSPDSAGVVTETPVTVDTGFPHHIGRVIVADATNGIILVDGLSEHFDDLRVENKLKTTQLVADSASLLNVQFDTTTFSGHQPYSEGLLFYDNEHKNLNYYNDISGLPIEIGTQEHQRVFNNSGSVIKKGSVLYFNGNYTSGAQDVPTVALADASSSSAYNSQGLAAHDIANNSYGMLLLQGQLTEVNTANLNADDQFFVSATTPGGKTNTPPTYPNFPMCMGWVVVSGDSSSGVIMANRENHSVNSFRVRTSAHIGTDLQVDGNLTILGSQTTVGQANVTQGSPIYRLNEGDAIGEAGTTFTGTGLDDAFFAGHFTGTSAQSYYVRIDGVGTGAGGVDTFAVALGDDSAFASPVITKEEITTNDQLIHSTDNISVNFGASTGHDSGDTWKGTASPINVDTGFFTNRNTGTSGVGYTHMGFFFDVSDEKWKLIDEYDSTPTGTIVVTDSSLGIMVAAGFEGPLTGAVTGNASTATALAAGRDFSLTGDITASAVSFDGTGAVQLTTAYNPGSIVNADINGAAAIADTKLATISTAGKVNNSATTATNVNTGSTIVARDASGDFNAGTVRLDELFVGNLHVDSADIISLARGSLSGGTGITYNSSTGAISTTDGDIVHDNLSGFVANEHIDHTTVSITAGAGLSGGGTIAATRTLNVGAGAGITVNADNLQIDSSYTRGLFSASGDLSYNSGTGAFSFSETYSTASELLTAIKTVDGGSSGLDADLLDGQEGTHYRINVYNSSGTLLN